MRDRRHKGDDLTGRRNGYALLRKELHWFFKKIWIVVIIIGVTSTLGLVGVGILLDQIQDQRLEACESQNLRHDNTESRLREAAQADEDSRETEDEKAEVRRRRDVTIGLIDALAPKQDCMKLIETGLEAYLP